MKMNRNSAFIGALTLLALSLTSCGGRERMEEVEIPTNGLITTVVEVEPDAFKIEDETTVPDTASSLIVAKYLNGNIDTFTLAQVRLMQNSGHTGSSMMSRGIMTAAGAGLMGYMMGRAFSRPPMPSAYTNQQTYNRVNQTTGSTFRSGVTRVSRPSSGFGRSGSRSSGRSSSGFGGGRSTRGFGG